MTNRTQTTQNINKPSHTLGVLIICIYVCFIGLPLLALIIKAASSASVFTVILSPTTIQAIKLSIVTSVISVIVIVVVGTPVAYMISRSDSKILKILDVFIELPIILPPVVAGVAMLMAFGRQGIIGAPLEQLGITIPFTTTAVIFAQIFVAAPFYIRSARISFGTIDNDLEDLSRTLGKSPWYTFWRITIPLTWTGLTTGLALTWARSCQNSVQL
jgi:ABC-type sulfate transport system, permease component